MEQFYVEPSTLRAVAIRFLQNIQDRLQILVKRCNSSYNIL